MPKSLLYFRKLDKIYFEEKSKLKLVKTIFIKVFQNIKEFIVGSFLIFLH